MTLWYLFAFQLLILSVSSSPLNGKTKGMNCDGTYCKVATAACTSNNVITSKVYKGTTYTNGTITNHRDAEGSYFANEQCGWIVTLPEESIGRLIKFFFTELNVEEACDFVEVYDGPSANYDLIVRLTGENEQPPPAYYTTGRSMFVLFKTNEENQLTGFKLVWESVHPTTGCQSTMHFTDQTSGMIQNVRNKYGYEIGQENCAWNITLPSNLAKKGYVIRFKFTELHKSSYSSHYVSIYDGISTNHPRMLRVCSTDMPLYPLYSSGPNALVRNYNDLTEGHYTSGVTGFTLIWNAVLVTEYDQNEGEE